MRDFHKLQVWQKAHALVLAVYKLTGDFPKTEKYGLISQIRRAAVSIASNIAEGCGRDGEPELGRFMQIAMGSASEVEYELLLAYELGFLAKSDYDELASTVSEIKRMLLGFFRKLKAEG